MTKISRAWCTAALVACMVGGARGQNSDARPMVRPAVDPAALAKATDKGQAMLSKAKWKAEINMSAPTVSVAGPAVVCTGIARRDAGAGFGAAIQNKTVVLDNQTGRSLWESDTQLRAPMAWVDNGIVAFEGRNGQSKLQRQSADNPAGVAVWETTYTPPPATSGTSSLQAIFADQQIITGESWGIPRGGRGLPADAATGTTLHIRSFDRKTGHLQWETPVPDLRAFASVAGVAEGNVYVLAAGTAAGPQKGLIMCLNAADGKEVWKKELEMVANLAVAQGPVVYTLAQNSEVIGFDAKKGDILWRTALSKDCDPGKSKLGEMSFKGDLRLDKDRLLAAVCTYPFEPNGPSPRTAGTVGTDDGIAVLDLKTGRQTGYFNDKGVTDKTGNTVDGLQVQGDLLIADRFGLGCLGIDRKTLQLEWYIPANRTVTADGMLYVIPAATANTPMTITAVPVDGAK